METVIKQRKGFTMLETVVSFAMFSIILLLVLSTSYVSFSFSHFVSNTAVDMAKTRSTVSYIQRTFESAQRMQYGDIVPSGSTNAMVESITFKRATTSGSYWTDLTVNGTTLKSGNATLLSSATNIMVDFYSPAGLLLASNHVNVPVIPDFNNKGWEYFKVRYVTVLNNDYFPITAIRKVTPYYEAPYVTTFNNGVSYTFSIPLDTTKSVGSGISVTYATNSNVVNSNANTTQINNVMPSFSSYLGIPAKKSAQITITPNPTASTTDYALYFDGVDDKLPISWTQSNVANTFTMEMWVLPQKSISIYAQSNAWVPNGTTYAKNLVISESHGGDTAAGAGISVGTNGIAVIEHGTNYYPQVLSHSTTITGWTHIAIVYNNRTPSLYINGQFIKTGLTSGRGTVYPGVRINYQGTLQGIGFGAYGYYQGLVDEVRIWNIARSQSDIQADMNRQLTGNEPGLVGYWKLDEGSGNTVYDSTSNNSNGSISGAQWVVAPFELFPSPFELFPFNWEITLTDKLTNTPLSGKTVYAYDSNGHFNQYVTDEEGSFTLGDYSGFTTADITFFFPGDENYAPATARH